MSKSRLSRGRWTATRRCSVAAAGRTNTGVAAASLRATPVMNASIEMAFATIIAASAVTANTSAVTTTSTPLCGKIDASKALGLGFFQQFMFIFIIFILVEQSVLQ